MTLTLDLAPLLLGGLAAVRVLTFLMAVPALGIKAVPVAVKVGLALWVTAGLLPQVVAQGAAVPSAPGPLALAVAAEFAIGLLLAMVVAFAIGAVQLAGEIVGLQIGFGIVNVIDPMSQLQVSVLGQLYYMLAALVFVGMDGPAIVLRGIAASFSALPPGGMAVRSAGVAALVLSFSGVFSAALRMSLPPVVALLLVSLAMGIVGRTVPQLNILVVGFPVRIAVGLLILAASLPLLTRAVSAALGGLDGQLVGMAWGLAPAR